MLNIINIYTQNQFLLRALVACIIISLSCPILGFFMIVRRMSLMGDAISHAILPGVAIGYLIAGMSTIAMTIGGIIAGLIVTISARLIVTDRITIDTALACFYFMAISLGVIIISHSGTNLDLMHILFGSILAIDNASMILLATIASFSLIVLSIIIRALVLDTFDENILKMMKIKTMPVQSIFLLLLVLNLVIQFQIIGTVLVIGLMIIPASAAMLITRNLNYIFIFSILISVICSCLGITASYFINITTGPCIVLLCGLFYCLILVILKIKSAFNYHHYKSHSYNSNI
jgi:zinc/manganese transport system permease protein